MMNALVLNAGDDVAVLASDRGPGLPAGHKIARHALKQGQVVRKYGQVIGVAAVDIAEGDWVHVHNLAMTDRPRDVEIGVEVRPARPDPNPATFQGYRRPDGRAGTRNFILVLTTVNCSATVARRIASAFQDAASLPQNIDGVLALTHTGGCGGSPGAPDIQRLQATLCGYARNPNVAGVLMVGLGCEANQIPSWLERSGLEIGDTLRVLSIQESGGTTRAIEAGCAIVADLMAGAALQSRETLPASGLTLGLQCGGSDAWSGITANPALGFAVDRLISSGGSALLSETPEIWGAEHLLLRRAATGQVADGLLALLDWWQAYAERHGLELNNNPSPGNLKGGLSTILEKSLGAVSKCGSTPLMDVIGYAEPVRTAGLTFMDSPGFDPCSATGQIAAGANLIAFTTGRGSVFGSRPAPCLKIASNGALARWMDQDIDIDASPVLSGESIEVVGERIFQRLLATASGAATASETLGMGEQEFVPWQVGAYL